MFVIEDDEHAEELGRYPHRVDAITELRRLSQLPWDEDPNRAPCQNWQTCGRSYVLIEIRHQLDAMAPDRRHRDLSDWTGRHRVVQHAVTTTR